ASPYRSVLAVEAQRQALRAAAGLDELVQLDELAAIARRPQIGPKLLAACVDDHVLADNHRVASKSLRLLLDDRDQLRNVLRQYRAAIGIERIGEIDRLVGRKWTEARVKMIESLVHQLQRQHHAFEHFAQMQVPGRVAANAIAREQDRSAEQRVAGPLEVNPL